MAQKATMRMHETQIGQIANRATTRAQGTLLSNTEANPNEQVNAITTRSGLETKDSPYPSHARAEVSKAMEKEARDKEPTMIPNTKDMGGQDEDKEKDKEAAKREEAKARVPYPQRLKGKDDAKEYSRFLELFKKLHINIPFEIGRAHV